MKNINSLPDCYRKDKNSNNYKLLHINSMAIEELKKEMLDVWNALDLNQAIGKTLNLYGEMVEQKRGLLNDEQYRYMIYAKIGRNIVRGDYNSIMDALVLMFGSTHSDISMDDLEIDETDNPCVVKLNKFPLFVLVDAGFSSRQAIKMIEFLLPVCVTLSADNFEGTFEFAEFNMEYDKTAGFADDRQTFGGYFGLLLGEDDTIPVLPI